MKKLFALLLTLSLAMFAAGCDAFDEEEEVGDDTLYIYSWGY